MTQPPTRDGAPARRSAADLQPFGPPPAFDAGRIEALERADREHLWKPFTQMAGYVAGQPLIIAEGRGAWLRDVRGRALLDGVSSLWVNVHGHAHPVIAARIRDQLDLLDHSTLLGPTNVPAVELAARLVELVPGSGLRRVFYSDSGSTAVEIAVKMAYQYFAQHRDHRERRRDVFVTLSNAYHGDTLGSVSVGGIDLFHAVYRPLLFSTARAPAPDPYHRAFGEDPAAHERSCLSSLREVFAAHEGRVAALVMEPLVQGAAGMIRHSAGYLADAAAVAREHGALLILDEVATGFGRSGSMFAFQTVPGLQPDLLCLAKGISGGVLPLAATLATERVYEGFLGDHTEYRTFFHGHSYTGNPIACAAALGSLDVFEQEHTLARLAPRIDQLERRLEEIARLPHVGDVRRLGVMTGIELVEDPSTGQPWDPALRVGNRVIEQALEHGVLLRPLGDVVVLMPPLSITEGELDLLCDVVEDSIRSVCAGLAG